ARSRAEGAVGRRVSGTDRMSRRHAVGLVIGSVLVAGCPCAFALDPALDISQYVHRSWRIRDGFTKGRINALAQTPDGYLWLGTEFGLLRFDGVRNVPWSPPAGQDLPSTEILSLLTTRDGSLWIGTPKGLVRWKDGRLITCAPLAGQFVFSLVEDREGVVWAGGAGTPTGRLCAIRKESVECQGEDGRLGRGVFRLYEDRA